jgi:L-threonylcarbamoyladenylate synthase
MTQASHPQLVAADEGGIRRATAQLMAGRLVAVPTETVYGLAARADREGSVAQIFRAKGRPSFNPLIVHVADIAQARRLATFDDRAERLAEAFWPGPLTLVLPMRPDADLAPAVTAGLPTVALRCPAHPVMRRLLVETALPLAAPSANRSGAVSPTCAEHVARSLGANVDMILDGGACSQGVESTIVALRVGAWQILRPGPLALNDLASLLGTMPLEGPDTGIEAPGQLASHYAPGKPLRLDAKAPADDEFFIGFGAMGGDVQLSAGGDLAEAASRLYSALHQAAASAQPRIAIASIPHEGIGAAINDRLRRAAA